MHKKLMMACMAIAAFAAFIIAPAASASPVLTDKTSNGTVDTLQPGAWITGTNTGETKFTGSVNVNCSTAHLTGTVTENSGTSIKGEVPLGNASFTGTATGGDCTSSLLNSPAKVTVNSALCLASVKGTDNMTTTGCSGNVSFTLELTGNGPCKFETASVSGTFPTNAAATVNVSEQEAKLVSGGFFCPSSGKLDMDFDLYTTDGTVITTS